MKKFFWVNILLMSFLMLFTACSNGAQDKEIDNVKDYYNQLIVPLKVEENLDAIGSKMTELQNNIAKNPPTDDASWAKVEEELSAVIKDMEAKKKELVELKITNEEIKEVHQYLIDTYDNLITGYSSILPAMKDGDAAEAQKAQEALLKAKELVTTWLEKINE